MADVPHRLRAWAGPASLAIAAALAIGLATLASWAHPRQSDAVVDGLRVMTVSEALVAHAADILPGDRVALRGFWSASNVAFSCAAPVGAPGDLELYCVDGQFGVTENYEPIFSYDLKAGIATEAKGPHLTPWIPPALPGDALFAAKPSGEQYPPTPIVITGHFDDARVLNCRSEARQLCVDRLVVDRVVAFARS